jgi:cytosine permease
MAGSTQHHSRLEDAEEQVDHLLGSEYEHEPVPASARRSLFSVTLVWAGFLMIITSAMTGSILVLGMGFTPALTAKIIGNLVMLGYVGALGILGTRGGVNFALLASMVFGRKGYVLASGLPCCSDGTRCRRGFPARCEQHLWVELRADDGDRRPSLYMYDLHRRARPAL